MKQESSIGPFLVEHSTYREKPNIEKLLKPTKSREQLLKEVPVASKKILFDLESYLKENPDPKTMMSNQCLFISRSSALIGIIFELFSLLEPASIIASIEDIIQSQLNMFYCPCGSTVNEEAHLVYHLRTKHFIIKCVYQAIKKSMTDYQHNMSEARFKEKIGDFLRIFDEAKETSIG